MLVSSAVYAPSRRHPLKHVITHGARRPTASPGSEMLPSCAKAWTIPVRTGQVEPTAAPVISLIDFHDCSTIFALAEGFPAHNGAIPNKGTRRAGPELFAKE